MPRPSVLLLCDHYLPGFQAGGPVKSISNAIKALSSSFDFKVLTRDRDLGVSQPYTEVPSNTWCKQPHADVMYLSRAHESVKHLCSTINATDYDVLYINSFFSASFSILPLWQRRLGRLKKTPVVLAPRGEFSAGALQLKWLKKATFLTAAKTSGAYRDIFWQATSESEEADIRRQFGARARVLKASNLPDLAKVSVERDVSKQKQRGALRIVSLGRVCLMKNFLTAIRVVADLKGQVEFDMYGPIEDVEYWAKCQAVIATLPPNVVVNQRGAIHPQQIASLLIQYDLFFLPTLGENFGHAIFESLSVGCPVLVSDRTPWRNLTRDGVGWDLALDNQQSFVDVLQACVDMEEDEHRLMRQKARSKAEAFASREELVTQNVNLFHTALDEQERHRRPQYQVDVEAAGRAA